MRALLTLILLVGVSLSPLRSGQESFQVTGGLGRMLHEYLTQIAKRQWEERTRRVSQIRTPKELEERQAFIRTKVLEELGGFPTEKAPLNPRVTLTLKREGYLVENLIYESFPNYFVTANVYVPVGAKAPYPAVIITAGHSANGKAFYQQVPIALAKRGILAMAFDPMGQGERLEYYDPDLGRSRVGAAVPEHNMAGLQCLLTGTNFARYEIWDGIRALDYLLTRKDVDPKRIGVAGNSGGGTQAAYLAMVEPRLAVAAPSCYMTSWEALWSGPGPQDAEQVFTRFLKDGLDFGDFAIAYAPRPFEILAGMRDFFPIDGARATAAEARRTYGILGKADQAGFFEYDDPHGWSKPRREATYRWMEQWLTGRDDQGTEPSSELEPDANLNCTPTGQVSTSLGGETVRSLNLAMAERIYPQRTATKEKDPQKLRSTIAARIGVSIDLSGNRAAPPHTEHGAISRDGYRIEKIALETEKGIAVPALVSVPATGGGKKPAVLFVDSAGKSSRRGAGDPLSLAEGGYIVLAVDPRGWGESAPEHPKTPGSEGYPIDYQTAMRALLVGKTWVGMQVDDLLRSFDYLASRPDVDPKRIAVFGKGNGGVLALYAAALEPRVEKVVCERAVLSYMSIVRAKLHENMIGIVVPGVLHDFDLPDVAFAIAPRTLWIVDPRTPTGGKVASGDAAAEYGVTAQAFRTLNRAESFRIVPDRPAVWTFEKVYGDWMR